MPNLLPAKTIIQASKAPDKLIIELNLTMLPTGALSVFTQSQVIPPIAPDLPPPQPTTATFLPGDFLPAVQLYRDGVDKMKLLQVRLLAEGWLSTITSTGLNFL